MPAPAEPDLPRFRTLRPLGAGGGGRVRLVRDVAQQGALRALKLGLPGTGEEASAVRAALLREARALSALRHPALPRLFESGVSRDGTPWLLLEFVDGTAPPRDRDAAALRNHVVATARSLLEVLAYLHRHGWLHRDVKPENVLTTAAGRVVLVDFGLAEREDVAVPARGTLPFVAPEVLAGEDADPRSDLFGAGAALLVLATGLTFAPGTSLGPEFVPDDAILPPAWLRSMLETRRDARPENAERALAALDAALGRAPAPLPRRALPHSAVPAGRATEIETIVRRMRETRAATDAPPDAAAPAVPGIVLVRGASGVGKSRLLQELRLRAIGEGWAPLHGSCSDERDAPMPALRSILDRAALLAGPGSHALRRGRRGAADAGPPPATEAAAAPRDADETAADEGATDRGDPAESAARFLDELAHELGGLLLVVEDLQDAAALSVRVIATLARRIAEGHALGNPTPLLVVATLTDGAPVSEEVEEGLRSLEAEGLVQTVPLRPLGPDDVVGLVRGVLGPHAPHDRIAEVLRVHGGALPLFAEELLARLVEDGALRHDGSRWSLDPRHTPALPESLTAAMRARLERLPPAELRAVQLLATYELPVPRAAADRMLGDAAGAALASLEAAGFVAPMSEGGAAALVHAVVAQTALSMLGAAARAELHDAVAAAIPRADPGAAVRRAYHVSRGTAPDAALAAATDAARKLRDAGEPGRAAGFVRQALRVLPERDPRIPRLRRSLADLLVRSGRPEAAANVYRDLLADEREPVSRAVLLLGLADALDGCGLPAETRNVCREGLERIARLPASDPDVAFTRLSLLARLAGAERATGELREAIETVKAALALAGPERVAERASLLSLLGNVYVQLGDFVRARQFHESCLAACRDLGRRRGMATALHNLAVVHARLGERAEAQSTYRQALRLARRANDLPAVAQTLGNLANLRAEAGDFAVAERLQTRSLAIRRRTGDRAGSAIALGNLAGVLRARGRMGRALAMLQTAVKRLQAAGDVEGEALFLLQAASIHLWANDLLGARPLLVRALALARDASLRGPEAGAELLLGRLERRIDPQSDEWVSHLERSRTLCEMAGDRKGAAEALLEAALGERDRGRRGSAILKWRAATAFLAGTGAADTEARAALVRGRIESDRAPDADVAAGVERFLVHARSSGRRDYLVTACIASARARLAAGDAASARPLVAEAERTEDDLEASLPPGLRRCREQSPVRGLLARLRADIDNAPPSAARPGASVPGSGGGAVGDASAPGATGGAASDPIPPSGDDMDQDRLLKLLEINKQLNQAQDMRALLDTIMDVATESTGGERGFLIVVEDQKISFQAARNFQREQVAKPELKISSSVVKRVMRSGQPILTDNAKEDERFAEFKSVERLELKSILAVPFRVGTEVMGALYLDNPARKGAFGPGDLQFLSALGDQAALAIRNLRQAESMAALNRRLEQNLANKSAQLEVATKALSERATKYPYDEIVGSSAEIREVLLLLDKVADTDVPVLVQGESGTGKELIARAIHRYGRRRDGPFVGVNCGAITASLMESELFGHVKGAFTGAYADKKGLFEAANGGTIFLDEIGEMDVEMQKKLLRVLQEREVRPVGGKASMRIDVRVIAATNRDLRKMTQEGRFREDLYYRVAVISLTMPSLRERAEDIPALVEHCVARAGKELGLPAKPIDDDAMDALQAWSWPGNVRELDNEVKKSLTLSGERVTLQDLSPQIQEALRAPESHGPEPALVAVEGGSLKESLEKAEKTLIERALDRTSGNQTRAARDLGISRVWLRKKMEKYGLLPQRGE